MVQKLSKGRYRVQVRVAGRPQGGVFPTKDQAEEKERELKKAQAAVRAGMEAPDQGILVFDASQAWLKKRFERGKIACGTVAMEESRLRVYILPRIGTLPLAHCTTKLITELLDEIQFKPWTFQSLETRTRPRKKEDGPLSNATRNRIRALLHTLFEEHVRAKKIAHNPVTHVPIESEKRQVRPYADPLSKRETEKLIEAGYAKSEQAGFCAVLFIYTGGRVSQMAALQNRDFDLKRNQIHFVRIYEQETHRIENRIKGHPEGLIMPLFPRVKDAYLRHKKATAYPEPEAYCIHQDDGRPRSTYSIRALIKQLCRRGGIRTITPHVLRATFATLGEEAGLSKEDLQRLLGHSSVTVTQRYTRRKTQPLYDKAASLGFGKTGKDEEE